MEGLITIDKNSPFGLSILSKRNKKLKLSCTKVKNRNRTTFFPRTFLKILSGANGS